MNDMTTLDALTDDCVARRSRIARQRRGTVLTVLAFLAIVGFVGSLLIHGSAINTDPRLAIRFVVGSVVVGGAVAACFKANIAVASCAVLASLFLCVQLWGAP